jgi:hypothetical protein
MLPDFIHRFRGGARAAHAMPQCGLLLAVCGALLLCGQTEIKK